MGSGVESGMTGASAGDQRVFECHLLTLFPAFFDSPLSASIVGRALERGDARVGVHNIRDFAEGRHKQADDSPYGGGAGMVMKPAPIVRCLEAIEAECAERGVARPHRVAMTPGGQPFNQKTAQRFARMPALSLVCGRYEGMDERVMDHIDEEVSLGDFVLTGGEPAALTMFDAVIRLLPGVLGNSESAEDESFSHALLEYPQYTRPAVFRGAAIPEVLTSGDHGRIRRWRRGQALWRTLRRRPDLLDGFSWTEEDRQLLEEARRAEFDKQAFGAESAEEES